MVANRIQVILNSSGDLRLSGWIPCHHKGLLDVEGGGSISEQGVSAEAEAREHQLWRWKGSRVKEHGTSKIWER